MDHEKVVHCHYIVEHMFDLLNYAKVCSTMFDNLYGCAYVCMAELVELGRTYVFDSLNYANTCLTTLNTCSDSQAN